MRVLLTTILIRSGLLTHVWDLAHFLKLFGVEVCVAIFHKQLINPSEPQIRNLLGPIVKVPHCFYQTTDELIKFTKEQQIELVHAHSSSTFMSVLEMAKTLELPLVVTLHAFNCWEELYPKTLSYAKKIIAVGPAQAEYIGSSNLAKTLIIANGIDTKHFQPRSLKPEPMGPLKVLWFGRTHGPASDGVERLDKAIKLLKSEGKEIEAWLVGQASGSIVNSFKVLGWVNNPLPVLQWGHIAFGHGRALREAMACGNIGFLLGHGYKGQVKTKWFTPKNTALSAIPHYNLPLVAPEVIASDLRRLYGDRVQMSKYRQQAREMAVKFFDVQVMLKKITQIYQSTLN